MYPTDFVENLSDFAALNGLEAHILGEIELPGPNLDEGRFQARQSKHGYRTAAVSQNREVCEFIQLSF
jgi:hypothetical protein